MKSVKSQILVIFGASGDLTKRKLIPALFSLFQQKMLTDKFAVLGIGRTDLTDDAFRHKVSEFLPANENIDSFLSMLFYLPLQTSSKEEYPKIGKRLQQMQSDLSIADNVIYYLSTPPSLYPLIPKYLYEAGLANTENGTRRLIVEKPFGTDLESAKNLNRQLLNYFEEDNIYRIDHYLGKETVQNLLVLRFSNSILEPLWNQKYIDNIQITSAEKIGVEERGGYYDDSGAMRDMFQNHLMQLLGLIAMEPPAVIDANTIRNETMKVFQSLRPITKENMQDHVIRGQYTSSHIKGELAKSYREEKGVNPESRTETFLALKLFIDNWRWGDVPFYIRTGKHLPTRATEIVINYKSVPHHLFCDDGKDCQSPNQLIIRVQPDEGVLLKMGLKVPGAGFKVQTVNMDFHYSDLSEVHLPSAYERLLLDCMQGDATLYSRGDAVEKAWEFVQPILDEWQNNPDFPLYGYPAGTWGPEESEALLQRDQRTWRYPCKNLANDGEYCEL